METAFVALRREHIGLTAASFPYPLRKYIWRNYTISKRVGQAKTK